MTVSEARVILFLGEALTGVATSLRDEQTRALSEILDMKQKIVLLDVLSALSPPSDVFFDEKRAAWARLVEAAKERVAVSEDPLRPMSPS